MNPNPSPPSPLTAGCRESVIGPHGADPSEQRQLCSARSKSTGERCRRAPIRGATVCYVHGGMAPQVRDAARRRLEAQEVEREIRNAIAYEAHEGVADPLEVLSQLAAQALATERALAARVNDLAADDRLRYKAPGSGTEQLRAEVSLWERWHQQAAKLVELLARHDFVERQSRISEIQGRMVVQALRAIFDRLDLTPAQQELLPTVVPEELRKIGELEQRTVAGKVVPR